MKPNSQQYDETVAIISDWYATAENRILEAIARRIEQGINNPSWYDQKLSEIRALQSEIRNDLQASIPGLGQAISSAVKSAFTTGWNTLDDPPLLTRANTDAIKALATELTTSLESLHTQILRLAVDSYRTIIGETVGVVLTGSVTRKQAASSALMRFARDGIKGFIDKAGRKWGITEYVEMATRTALTRAYTEGNLQRYELEGYNLVTIPPNSETCPTCDPFENKIFIIKGTHPKYKPLSSAISAGLFHPNCGHRPVPYIEGMTQLPKKVPKEEREKAYEDKQRQRELERQIRQAKREEAAAITPEDKKHAKDKIKQKQAELREHIAESGRLRDYSRERA